MPKMVAKDFAIRRDMTGRIFLELTNFKQRKFEFEIGQSSLPTIRGHLIEALNLPRSGEQSGFHDMAAPILPQRIHVTLNHPVAGVMSLRFEASNGSATDIPLSTSDAAAMVEAVRQALGAASYEHHPDESSDTAAQILSFQCECDPETQMIVLRFEAENRSPIVVTLPAPRAEDLFESIGKALTIVKSEPTVTKQ
jgi:hypothetical protein